jgi:hypothetical protein
VRLNLQAGHCLQILEAASKLGNSGWEYAMEASFIEVYNESLRDLLGEGRNPREPGKVLDNNAIKHMADGKFRLIVACNGVVAQACGKHLQQLQRAWQQCQQAQGSWHASSRLCLKTGIGVLFPCEQAGVISKG